MVTVIPATKGLLEYLSNPPKPEKTEVSYPGFTMEELVAATGRTETSLRKEMKSLILQGKVRTSKQSRHENLFGYQCARFEYILVLDTESKA